MNKHTEGRTEVSSSKWVFGLAAQVFLSVLVIGSVYTLNAGRFEYSGFVALGGVVAVIYFSSLASGKPHPVVAWLMKAAIVLFTTIVLAVEIFSMAANYMAYSAGSDLDQYRAIKQSAISKQEAIKQEKEDIKNGTMTDAQKAYHIGLKDKAGEKYDGEAKMVIDSNQSKVFSDLDKWLGVSNSEGLYRTILSALAIIALPLIMSSRNGTWCGLTLYIYNKQQIVLKKLLNPAEIKTTTKPAVDIKGTQADEPTDDSPFDRDYEAAKGWVNGHKTGQRVFVGRMKKACKGGANWQHEAILFGLQDDGLLQKKENGGTSPLYYKRKPEIKQQVLEQMKSTSKFLKLVTSK